MVLDVSIIRLFVRSFNSDVRYLRSMGANVHFVGAFDGDLLSRLSRSKMEDDDY